MVSSLSNKIFIVFVKSVTTSIFAVFLNSIKSAVVYIILKSLFKTSNSIFLLFFIIAPFHNRGENGLIGVITTNLLSNGKMEPFNDKL